LSGEPLKIDFSMPFGGLRSFGLAGYHTRLAPAF